VRFLVVCRGSDREGLGHLYRARSFAREAALRHDVRLVAIADRRYASLFDGMEGGCEFVSDDAGVPPAVAAFHPHVVVLDVLDLARPVYDALRGGGRLVVSISPIFAWMSDVDVLVTRGKAPEGLEGPRVHSGLRYAIFNDFCEPIPDDVFERAVSNPVLPVAVGMGGTDHANQTLAALRVLVQATRPCSFWVTVGDGYGHSYDALNAVARGVTRHEIVIARTNRTMWRVIGNCAVAVLSSGLSTLEAVYAGIPVISVKRRDPANQVNADYERLLLQGGSFDDDSHSQIADIIDRLHADRGALRLARQAFKGVLDGHGAARAVEVIEREATSGPARRVGALS